MARETEGKELRLGEVTEGVENLLKAPVYGFYVVAEHATEAGETEIVGALMVTVEWSDWRNGLLWWIQSVYVEPEFRRRGVYRALYEHLKKSANQKGYRGYDCCFRL